MSNAYENILTSTPAEGVFLITLNRPKALNALSLSLFVELATAMQQADADDNIGAIVLTGSERSFAAGGDIKQMKDLTYASMAKSDPLISWTHITTIRKPLIAAVSGFAIGGGFELALASDIVLASPSAQFSLPELNIGVIPGGGATQRLTRIVGKARAMDVLLTGRVVHAEEAERWGIVSRVVQGNVVDEAVEMAKGIAGKGRLSVLAAKEAVNTAFELSLTEGLKYERKLFQGLFATRDQKEGMSAFIEKRLPRFTNE